MMQVEHDNFVFQPGTSFNSFGLETLKINDGYIVAKISQGPDLSCLRSCLKTTNLQKEQKMAACHNLSHCFDNLLRS